LEILIVIEDDGFQPVKWFALLYFMGFGLFCLAVPLTANTEKLNNPNVLIFFYVLSGIHLLIGLGVLARKKWGFYCLKYYLYFLKPGFPIGTLIANKMLSHLNEHQIERYFDK